MLAHLLHFLIHFHDDRGETLRLLKILIHLGAPPAVLLLDAVTTHYKFKSSYKSSVINWWFLTSSKNVAALKMYPLLCFVESSDCNRRLPKN